MRSREFRPPGSLPSYALPKGFVRVAVHALPGLVIGCGWPGRGGKESPARSGVPAPLALPAALAKLAPSPDGFTWYVSPFAPAGEPNVHARVVGKGSAEVGGPLTIPGYHWPWRNEGAKWHLGSDSAGRAIETDLGKTAPATYALSRSQPVLTAFRVPFAGAWRERWPAVMGEQGTEAGHVSAPSFALLRPSDPGLPHRVYLVDEAGVPLPALRSTARSCGKGCADFAGLAELLDTPLSFSRTALHERAGAKVDFVFGLAQASSRAKADDILARSGFPAFADTLWNRLSRALGDIAPRYLVHVSLGRGCSYQGLEHSLSTALSLGIDCDSKLVRDFTFLVAHEMIHSWNAKQVFPREHASLPTRAFDPARTKQLYFYEGFTEGLARLSVAAWGDGRVPLRARLEKWNETLASVQGFPAGAGGFEARSLAAPSAGYTLGAWLAMRAGVEARKAAAAADVESAHARVLRILALVAGRESAEGSGERFVLSTPWFRTLTFKAWEAIVDSKKNAAGYDRDRIAEAFRIALDLPADHALIREAFGDGDPFADPAAAKAVIRDAAAVSGLTQEDEGGVIRLHSASDSLAYPF